MFDTFEIEGEIYACQFHVKGEGDAPPTVYAIVDTDGDGVFESKFAHGERAQTAGMGDPEVLQETLRPEGSGPA